MIHVDRSGKNSPVKNATATLMSIKLAVVEIKPNKIVSNRLVSMVANDLFRSNGLAVEFILLTKPNSIMTLNFLYLGTLGT
jgi:hypothetical protein